MFSDKVPIPLPLVGIFIEHLVSAILVAGDVSWIRKTIFLASSCWLGGADQKNHKPIKERDNVR